MNVIDYKLLEESFFNMYQAILNHLRLTRSENKSYEIYITRTLIQDNLYQTTIKITNNEQNFIFSDKLPLEESINLINNIRMDFKENHFISFSSFNENEKIHTLQNTNFTLKIQLVDNIEFEAAYNFNTVVNTDGRRYRVLTKA